jgi:hypothetical protein
MGSSSSTGKPGTAADPGDAPESDGLWVYVWDDGVQASFCPFDGAKRLTVRAVPVTWRLVPDPASGVRLMNLFGRAYSPSAFLWGPGKGVGRGVALVILSGPGASDPSPFRSMALYGKLPSYPEAFLRRVPYRVRLLTGVTGEVPDGDPIVTLQAGTEPEVMVNPNGAVTAITPGGDLLGLKPGEFEVLAWHQTVRNGL